MQQLEPEATVSDKFASGQTADVGKQSRCFNIVSREFHKVMETGQLLCGIQVKGSSRCYSDFIHCFSFHLSLNFCMLHSSFPSIIWSILKLL